MAFMGGGMTVTRKYKNSADQGHNAEVTIVANSPLLSSLSMFINNPALATGSNQKSVRVGTKRALLQMNQEEEYDNNNNVKKVMVGDLQIPLNATLITVKARGFKDEAAILAFANALNIDKIKAALGDN
jgi:hypothetical protein